MCPVRVLNAYVHRASLWRRADQLLLCYGSPKKGLPAHKAHSTRSMAASKAFLAGVPMQDICEAAGWSMPLTFVRFFDLDLQTPPGSSVLLP